MPYPTLEGFARSLMYLIGLKLDVPDHTLMSRRSKNLQVKIPRHEKTGARHIVVDSTGLKIYGEGEWKIRKHGASKRRCWIKVHLAVDTQEKDIVGVEVTTESWGDSKVFEGLIDQIDRDIDQIDADGAYDTREAYEVAVKHLQNLLYHQEKMRLSGKKVIHVMRLSMPFKKPVWLNGKKSLAIIDWSQSVSMVFA